MIGTCRPAGAYACAFLLVTPVSALLFAVVLTYFVALSNDLGASAASPAAVPGAEAQIDLAYIAAQTAFIRCLRGEDGAGRPHADCDPTADPAPQSQPQAGRRGRAIVYAIYFLQWLCLNAQLALFAIALGKTRTLNIAYAHLSDWAVNSGPMLGVLGTIVSFALLLGESGADGLAAIFNARFFDAATTTIMGGSVYLVCLLLTIWIGPAVKQ